jgi:hypothetical protein
MNEYSSDIDTSSEENILMRIQEGARVYDKEHNEIGHVDDVFLGALDPDSFSGESQGQVPELPNHNSGSPFMPTFALGGADLQNDPASKEVKTMRDRLLKEGFIHIEAGLLAKDRVALPDQIEKVEGSQLILNVTRDQLLKDDILHHLS